MFTASAVCLIQQSIKYRNYKSLIDELGVSWGDLGIYSNVEEGLKNADEAFYKEIKPVIESLKGLDQSDWSILTMLIQQYLHEHPVRKNIIKMIADIKAMELSVEPIRMEITPTMRVNYLPIDDDIVRIISS